MSKVDQLCEIGRRVVQIEAETLQSLIREINHAFADACKLLLACRGRIIVMGMGKSGHIARKIAATLSSTGSPAFFIHPGEAKHGDCGVMTSEDVVILLSNSGETEEIHAILPFIKHLQLPLIALTGQPHSTLAKAATVHLHIPITQEACPLGLAPTSSTTAALVMGDALAITLLQERGFTRDDFARAHPGGALGRRLLLRVHDMMHTGEALPIISPEASLKEAIFEMTQKKLGLTLVLDDHHDLVGIFTDGDIRRVLDQHADLHTLTIQEVMTRQPKTIDSRVLATDALQHMKMYKITSLVVVDDKNKPIGVIHLHDIIHAGLDCATAS